MSTFTTAVPTVPTIEQEREQLVAQEAERLDRLFPGWAERIHIGTLDLRYCHSCVLGQSVPGDYGDAYDEVISDGYEFSYRLGGPYADNFKFRVFWIDEILSRKEN